MKTKIKIALTTIAVLAWSSIISCQEVKKNNSTIGENHAMASARNTPEFYLYIENIYVGDVWTENESDIFFRIIIVSKEESKVVFIEKIRILDESNLELKERIRINDYILNFEKNEINNFALERWINAKKIEVKINGVPYKIDLSKKRIG